MRDISSPGVKAGQELTVVRREIGRTIARDDAGREWQLPQTCVSAGMIYEIDGAWLPQGDPQVQANLRATLERTRAQYRTADSSSRHVLERLGRAMREQIHG